MPTALLILNRRARRGTAKGQKVRTHLEDAGLKLIEADISQLTSIDQEIRKHAGQVDLVIAAGGDGTMNACLPAIVGSEVAMGILPLGTANNFARTLTIPMDLKDACDLIVKGRPTQVDVGLVNDRYFLTTASIGLSVRITRQLSKQSKRRWGRLAYVMAAARAVRRAHPFEAEMILPSRRVKTRSVQIVVGNGMYYGTKLRVADDAEIDDHLLDVLSVEADGWWNLLRVFPSLKKGDHEKRDDVISLRTREIQINSPTPMKIDVDGELIASTPATFRVLPNALKVIAPNGH